MNSQWKDTAMKCKIHLTDIFLQHLKSHEWQSSLFQATISYDKIDVWISLKSSIIDFQPAQINLTLCTHNVNLIFSLQQIYLSFIYLLSPVSISIMNDNSSQEWLQLHETSDTSRMSSFLKTSESVIILKSQWVSKYSNWMK